MHYLSRNDIETMAEQVIRQYKEMYVPKRRMCYRVDITELAEMLGFKIEYAYITKDGSILGQTSAGKVWTTIYDSNMTPFLFELDGSTILVDKRLNNTKTAGRRNFTIAHEIAHQIINREYPRMYGAQNRTFCDYRKSVKQTKKINNWYEWQADVLAAALLLPVDALKDGMFMFGLGDKMKMLSRKYSENRYNLFCEMADYLQVSRSALAYRMEQLGLLEHNRLVSEAQARKEFQRNANRAG